MSGQSAGLSLGEAKAMMKRTEASCAKPGESQGPKNAAAGAELCKKEAHQGK